MNDWLNLSLNPQSLSSLYGNSPDLEKIEVVSIHLNRDGASLSLQWLTSELPKVLPKKWNSKTVKKVSISVEMLELTSLEMHDWGANPVGTLRFSKLAGTKSAVSFQSEECRFEAEFSFLRVTTVQDVNY
jgi:hypothetical protein